MLGPPLTVRRILISRLIFIFFTGLRILTITACSPAGLRTSTPTKTSLYFPRPTLRITSYGSWSDHSSCVFS